MVADLSSVGLEIWAVLPPGSAEDAVMRFRRIFGQKTFGCSPAQLLRLRHIWISLAVQLTWPRYAGMPR